MDSRYDEFTLSDREDYQVESGFVEHVIGDADYEAYLTKQKAAADYEAFLAQQQAQAPPLGDEYYEEEVLSTSYEEITASIYEEYTIGDASLDLEEEDEDQEIMSIIPEENHLSFDLSASDLLKSPFAKSPSQVLGPSKHGDKQENHLSRIAQEMSVSCSFQDEGNRIWCQ